MALPADQQLTLYARVLSFDRHLVEHAGDEVVIGVLYQSAFRQSLRAKEAIFAAADLALLQIADRPIRLVSIDITSLDVLERQLLEGELDVVYVAPLRSIDIRGVNAFCRRHQIASITGVPEYVEEGIAVGLGERGGKPEILVNRDSANAHGMNFESRFLRLVNIR